MRRVVTWSLVGLTVLILGGLGAGGWYYSSELLPAPGPWNPDLDVAVVGSDPQLGRLALDVADGDLADLEVIGFRTGAGSVVLQGEVELVDGVTQRHAALLSGRWPQVGDLGRAEVSVHLDDPHVAFGIPTQLVDVPGPLGPMPAWRIVEPEMATDGTWAVLVHGRGAEKHEVNRVVPVLRELGLPSLAIAIRNDPDAPADPDGYGRFGDTEWEDLDAAARFLRGTEGAERFVLVGYSQGGGIVLNHLRRSELAGDVDAAVLISPLVSLEATLRQQAALRDIPGPLIGPLVTSAQLVSRLRSGMVAGNLEHARDADELVTPLLVTHGDADTTVPVGPSRELATARPDLVTYEEYPGVEHVREWNADPIRFEADLRAFLKDHVPAAGR